MEKEIDVKFTENQDEIGIITVCGKEFKCLSGFGYEYMVLSNDKYQCGFPILPYKKEVKLSENKYYLIDACDIIWICGQMTHDDIDYGNVFFRPCHREAEVYTYGGYENYLKEVLKEKK